MKTSIKKKPILTSADFTLLINYMKVVFPTHDDVETLISDKLDEKLKYLPSKEFFSKRMYELSGEIQKVRDEQTLHSEQHTSINDRFEKLDKHLGISTSS